MNFARSFQRTVSSRRKFGWLTNNKRVEELAGLRESTYRDYALTPTEIVKHLLFLILPFSVIYYNIKSDLLRDFKVIGREDVNLGFFGPLTREEKKVGAADE
jgi:hypothetical protein